MLREFGAYGGTRLALHQGAHERFHCRWSGAELRTSRRGYLASLAHQAYRKRPSARYEVLCRGMGRAERGFVGPFCPHAPQVRAAPEVFGLHSLCASR